MPSNGDNGTVTKPKVDNGPVAVPVLSTNCTVASKNVNTSKKSVTKSKG
jgi:hypothetical protein